MRTTITNNNWAFTQWGLAYLRVSSFPLDPSCVFDTEEEFNTYLNGEDIDKPYLGLLVAVKKDDKYHVYIILSKEEDIYVAEELNQDDLVKMLQLLVELKDRIDNDLDALKEEVGQDMANLIEEVKDSALPEYDSFKKLLDHLIRLLYLIDNNRQNLLTELDLTLVGVGLSSDGSYSPDLETHYLLNATSVMNALKTLDSRVYLNDQVKGSMLSEAYYDSEKESLVLKFDLGNEESLVVTIPVEELITEWIVDNLNNAVTLNRERVINGPDILSVDLNIDNSESNILQITDNGLSATVLPENIVLSNEDNTTLKDYILNEGEWYEG